MSRLQIKKDIYADLRTNTALLALLGPVSERNHRVYSGYPQIAPALSGNNVTEGWLIFYEEQSVILYDTIAESVFMDFHVWATSLSIGEDAIDILDSLYHWRIAGQNSRFFGERLVLNMKRIHCLETYDDAVKLYRKIGRYKFQTVLRPFSP